MTPEPLMTDAVARLRRWAAERADATLLRTRGRAYTYADMEARATRVAAALLAAAGRRGARVALVLEEYDQFFVCMLGAWLAGQVVVPLNTSLPQHDVEWLVGKSQPDVIVLPDDDACPTPRRRPRPPGRHGGRGRPCGRRARGRRRSCSGRRPRRARSGARGRAGDDHVHVRHHRPAQGRVPDAARSLEQRRQRRPDARPGGRRPHLRQHAAVLHQRHLPLPHAAGQRRRRGRPARLLLRHRPARRDGGARAAPASAARPRISCAWWSPWRSRASTRSASG